MERKKKPENGERKEEKTMVGVICIDDKGGMMFNKRRQSQDRILREDLLKEAAGRMIWMNGYSGRMFEDTGYEGISVDEEFLLKAGKEELCFVEDQDPKQALGLADELILYRWNRVYPADQFFDLSLLQDWTLVRTEEFAGSSHEKITKEIYKR